jgi:predicted signal transduction protein with EAL and GGDEF domain
MKKDRITEMTTEGSKYLCMSCDRVVDGHDTIIHRDQILCLFCATIEGAYYGRPNEYLPDEYYTWLKKEDENGSTEN